jgi:hypothetical protein
MKSPDVITIRSGYGRKRSDRFVTDPATGTERPTPEYLAAFTRALNGEALKLIPEAGRRIAVFKRV